MKTLYCTGCSSQNVWSHAVVGEIKFITLSLSAAESGFCDVDEEDGLLLLVVFDNDSIFNDFIPESGLSLSFTWKIFSGTMLPFRVFNKPW